MAESRRNSGGSASGGGGAPWINRNRSLTPSSAKTAMPA